jgi:hypothetical protein
LPKKIEIQLLLPDLALQLANALASRRQRGIGRRRQRSTARLGRRNHCRLTRPAAPAQPRRTT